MNLFPHWLRPNQSLALFGALALLMTTPGADAQINLSSFDAGAILNQEYRYFRLLQEHPYLFRPIVNEDTQQKESVIIDEAGLLDQKQAQGQIILEVK